MSGGGPPPEHHQSRVHAAGDSGDRASAARSFVAATDTRSTETTTQVDDNRIVDSGNFSLDDILNCSVDLGGGASDNNVLNGNDEGGGNDNKDGLLGGLL